MGTKFQLCKINKFWKFDLQQCDCSYQNCFVYLKFTKRMDLKCSHTQEENDNYEVVDMLISLIVVIISKHHIVYLKYVQFLFVSYTSIKL